jgi:hypothetical protein
MNAPAHFPAHLTEMPWSDRIEMAQADEPLAVPLLLSIIEEATRDGEPEWAKAAQYALDNGPDEPSRWDDLNALIADEAREEAEQAEAYAYETRTGREWQGFDPDVADGWRAPFGGSQLAAAQPKPSKIRKAA